MSGVHPRRPRRPRRPRARALHPPFNAVWPSGLTMVHVVTLRTLLHARACSSALLVVGLASAVAVSTSLDLLCTSPSTSPFRACSTSSAASSGGLGHSTGVFSGVLRLPVPSSTPAGALAMLALLSCGLHRALCALVLVWPCLHPSLVLRSSYARCVGWLVMQPVRWRCRSCAHCVWVCDISGRVVDLLTCRWVVMHVP